MNSEIEKTEDFLDNYSDDINIVYEDGKINIEGSPFTQSQVNKIIEYSIEHHPDDMDTANNRAWEKIKKEAKFSTDKDVKNAMEFARMVNIGVFESDELELLKTYIDNKKMLSETKDKLMGPKMFKSGIKSITKGIQKLQGVIK